MLGVDHQRASTERLSLEQIQAFLEASGEVGFKGRKREEVYGWVGETLRQQGYEGLKRSGRGLVRRYMEKMTGLSRAQTTRLITMYLRGEEVKAEPYRRRRFPQRYRRADIGCWPGVDEAHGTLSGPATRKLLERACYDFGDPQYRRLAGISVAQLYRLRGSRLYRERTIHYQPTRPTPVSIGERRKPEPRAGRDTCGWTRCIRATWRVSRGSTTSTRWTRSRNGRWWVRWRRSAKRG